MLQFPGLHAGIDPMTLILRGSSETHLFTPHRPTGGVYAYKKRGKLRLYRYYETIYMPIWACFLVPGNPKAYLNILGPGLRGWPGLRGVQGVQPWSTLRGPGCQRWHLRRGPGLPRAPCAGCRHHSMHGPSNRLRGAPPRRGAETWRMRSCCWPGHRILDLRGA